MLAAPLFDHLISACQQRGRDRQAERLGRLEVDDEVELVDLLDRQVPGVGAEKDALDVLGREPAQSEAVLTIARQRSLETLPWYESIVGSFFALEVSRSSSSWLTIIASDG